MENKQTKWKSLDGVIEHGGRYEVSTDGRVRNATTGRVLKPGAVKQGYKRVGLSRDYVSKDYYVHRLVALAFIDNPENKPTVNHINGINTDNHVDNLEWATRSEQTSHALANGLYRKGEKHGRAFMYDAEVFLIPLIEDATREQIADAFSCSIQNVDRIRAGTSRADMKELANQLPDRKITLDQAITARAYFRYIKQTGWKPEGDTECI
ncbi:NUMOD4 domain-containing protein [Virgibacillus halodenitrificans]|uniref:NUMOD4 domain-containing protein n=1 Tax=Virgibacillus halodenitrificans TaxID=1482 RepID=UPI0024C0E544|nr:NUMOD4 domain-containing protein [Virgibacillus halodenitrificans]WHX27457.1 NUMOD4 domain-containing protein [Virgibacillus halodenitrificans]